MRSAELHDYRVGELCRIPTCDDMIGESQSNSAQEEHHGPMGASRLSCRGGACVSILIHFRAGIFYVYFMSVAFWIRPFFTDFCRYGENRKAVDNERMHGTVRTLRA